MSSRKYLEITLEQVPDDHPVAVFADYWAGRKDPSETLPRRTNIKPSEIIPVIPWLLILEKAEDYPEPEPQFRYRLAGTGCTELFGVDYTNKLLGDHLTADARNIRLREFRRALTSCQPIFSLTPLPVPDREFITAYRGVFPVSSNGSAMDQIFCVIASEQTAV